MLSLQVGQQLLEVTLDRIKESLQRVWLTCEETYHKTNRADCTSGIRNCADEISEALKCFSVFDADVV